MPSRQAQGSDGKVSEGGHGPGPGAGADGGAVFAVQGVVVQGLDRPLATDQGGDGFGGGAGGVPGW